MSPGDDSVCVDTLGRTIDNAFEVRPEIGGSEVGVEFLGSDVTQVLGELWSVVTAEAPRQLVFGKIARDKLDGIEGERFTGLPGSKNPVVNHLFRNLW